MATFPIAKQLNQYTNSQIYEILNVSNFYNQIKKDFPQEYWLDCNYILEALDLSSNISTTNLANAPFPNVSGDDTKADKAAKIAETWRQYPRIGLQLYLDSGNSGWIAKGQPIVIQNTPVQFPIPLISPYLNATAAVYLMGKDSRLGIKVVQGDLWQPIKGNDYITITGALRLDVQAKELNYVPIKAWPSISKNLLPNTLTKVLLAKPNRRYLFIQNAGTSNVFCGFNNDIGLNRGNLLAPNGSLSLDSQRYYSESEFWAYCPDNNGLLVGQEGLI